MLHMINHFREEMHRPLVGIGHSAGATELYELQGPLALKSLTRLSKVCSSRSCILDFYPVLY